MSITSTITEDGYSLVIRNLTFLISQANKNNEAEEGGGLWKRILDDVSVCVRPNSLTAILGPSGSGKTSLLNVVSGRVDASLQPPHANLTSGGFFGKKGKGVQRLSGEILYNGNAGLVTAAPKFCGYVMQADYFPLEFLTVEETITYVAHLRLVGLSSKERRERVNFVIRNLGLNKCRKTKVGGTMIKGISGGEKKRVSLAIELLSNPRLIFCDEPTSGLDASLAMDVVSVLQKLAKQGHTIVCTIHQPRSQVFSLFSDMVLLGSGKVVYAGPLKMAQDYFKTIGYVAPLRFNPADYFLDILTVAGQQPAVKLKDYHHGGGSLVKRISKRLSRTSIDGSFAGGSGANAMALAGIAHRESFVNETRTQSLASVAENKELPTIPLLDKSNARRHIATEEEVAELPIKFEQSPEKIKLLEDCQAIAEIVNPIDYTGVKETGTRKMKSYFSSIGALSRRGLKNTGRDPSAVMGEIFISVIVSIFMGIIFWKLPHPDQTDLTTCDSEDLHNTLGALSTLMTSIAFANFTNATTFVVCRPMFNREVNSRYYKPSAGYVGKTVEVGVYDYFSPVICGTVAYFMIGFKHDAASFFEYLLILCMAKFASTGFANFCGCMVPNLDLIFATAPLGNVIFFLVVGFATPLSAIPGWIRWVNYISYTRYGWQGSVYTQLSNVDYLSKCAGIDTSLDYWGNLGCCFAVGLLWRLLGFVGFKFLYRKQGMAE